MAQDDFQLLADAVKRAESGGRRFEAGSTRLLTSPKGAQGEMQVMPATQRSPGFGVEPAKGRDPEEIARVGRDYLKAMLDKYGNREHALAAYNWGPGNVDKWLAKGADPSKLPKETQDYIARVDRFMGTRQAAPAARPAAPEMDEATKGLVDATNRGLSAQAPTSPVSRETSPKLAELGPNYQAALALSVLADTDEEERKDRDIDDDREPSIAQKWLMDQGSRPAALASLSDISIKSPFPEPQKLKDGGEVSGKAKRALEELRESMREAGISAMSLPGAGMNLGYQAYKKITGTEPIEELLQKIERQNPPIDVTRESEPIKRADGGEVQEPNVFKVPLYSETVAYEMYPGQGGQFDQRDAARHMLAAGTLARKYGPTAAEILGKLHEVSTSPLRYIGSKLGISEMPVDYEQDLHNNRLGIELGRRAKSQKELEELVQRAAEGAKSQQMEGQPWIGRPQRPVKRSNGSPIGGEEADLSRPMTYNPKIRRQGEAARRLAAMRDVNTLPDPRTYAAVSGFFGVAPDEQGFSVLHPDLAGIQKAGEKGFAAGTVAQVAPMAAAIRGLGSAGTTTAAKMLAGMKDIPVGMAVKPRGGVFMPSEGEGVTSKLASTVDDYVEMAKRQDLPPEVQDFIRTKAPKYFTTTYGTAEDPLRTAIRERKIEPFGRDIERMPPYMVDAAKNPEARGHKQAKTDLERMYDQLTGLTGQYYSEATGPARTNLLRQAEIDRMTQEGVSREFMNPVHPEGFSQESFNLYPMSSKRMLELMEMQKQGTLPSHLQQALRTGELIYDVQPMFSLLQPREVAQALAQVAPNKLKNMSFPDAVIEGMAKLAPIRDYEAAISIAERGGRVPKEALFQFTQPVLKAEGQQWVQLTDPLAARMEGKLMNHSVGGYAEGDSYGTAYTGLKVGGKKAFDEGLVRVYSLRDEQGMPSITVEAAKKGDGWRISQVRGRFNSEPENKEAVFKLFDKLEQSENLNDIKFNSYNRSATGESIPGSEVDWAREYDFWKTFEK